MRAPEAPADVAAALRGRLDRPVTRFAPAPTGFLHLGHVVNAIYVWGLARALDGRVILRVEDHDRQRSRPEYERALLEDLDWLGFEPDVFPTDAYRAGRCEGRQSERDAVYRSALAPLIEDGLVYGCRCSRAEIERAQAARHVELTGENARNELTYAGTCRERNLGLSDDCGWRIRIDPGVETFDDGLIGPQAQDPARQVGDILVRDRLGNWTYQWVASVDDYVQDVSLVIRGVDLLASTGRQMRLARMVGRREPAVFVHHRLVMKSPTQKLSKSDGDTGVRDLRRAGWDAPALIGRAAFLAGLAADESPIAAADVAKLFSSRGPSN